MTFQKLITRRDISKINTKFINFYSISIITLCKYRTVIHNDKLLNLKSYYFVVKEWNELNTRKPVIFISI